VPAANPTKLIQRQWQAAQHHQLFRKLQCTARSEVDPKPGNLTRDKLPTKTQGPIHKSTPPKIHTLNNQENMMKTT
jgi:hypothetical protein